MDEKMAKLIKENKGLLRQLTDLNKRVKALEQKDTFFPIDGDNRHLCLLNSCIDNDKAILHKRELG